MGHGGVRLDETADRRPLPFGLRLDKWRAARQGLPNTQVSIFKETVEHNKDSFAGNFACRELGSADWRTQDDTLNGQLFEAAPDARPVMNIVSSDSLAPQRPTPIQTSEASSVASPLSSIPSPRKSMPSPTKKPASVLMTMMATNKLKGAVKKMKVVASLASAAKEASSKIDRAYCQDKLIEFLNYPGSLMAHGFSETDAKTLAIFSQTVRLSRGDVLVEAGAPCEHMMMILDGRLIGYHSKIPMGTFEVGSHIGTHGLMSGNSKHVLTFVADEDSMVVLLPHHRMLSYIKDVDDKRGERILKYYLEELYTKHLELEHEIEMYNSAVVVQNNFRVHVCRSKFWSIRDAGKAPASNIISKVWRGHHTRKWLR